MSNDECKNARTIWHRYIIDCGYRYINPQNCNEYTRKWVCDKFQTKGCKAYIYQNFDLNGIIPGSYLTYYETHNHPPYPENRKLDYPFPLEPNEKNSYEMLKAECECRRGNNPFPGRTVKKELKVADEDDEFARPPNCQLVRLNY